MWGGQHAGRPSQTWPAQSQTPQSQGEPVCSWHLRHETCICYFVAEVAWRKVAQVASPLALAEQESQEEGGGGDRGASRASPRPAPWPSWAWRAGAGHLGRETETPLTQGPGDSTEARHVSWSPGMMATHCKHCLQHCKMWQLLAIF